MFRTIYLLCIVLGILALYLDVLDRTSPLALTLVEWETSFGTPFHRILLPFGFLLLVLREVPPLLGGSERSRLEPYDSSILKAAPLELARDPVRPDKAAPPHLRTATDPPDAADRAWLDETLSRVEALVLDPQARIRVSPTAPAPFTLHLRDATPEQVRRGITQFGEFLASIPVPRRVRFEFESCSLPEMARHVQVTGALRVALPDVPFHATTQEWGVEVLFLHPDPRWDGTSAR
jgi:hypothetical protein